VSSVTTILTKGSSRKANWQGMNWIAQASRLSIYLRDGLACAYCGAGVETGTKLSLDHVVCHSHGGDNRPSNLITCCSRCNSSRANRSLEVFTEAVAAYVNHGVSGRQIRDYIQGQLGKDIKPFRAQAKALIAQRGSAAKALAAAHQKND